MDTKKKETKEEKQKRFESIAKTHQEKVLLKAALKAGKIQFITIN
tara:strand:+ start:3072 stop:3206 length:135 start_codon:yes stop_codon:yes gene_type:complete